MLFLVMSLLYWTQTEGGCNGPTVSISESMVLPAGSSFNLSCEFTCLGPQHVAQLRSQSRNVSLVNVTSSLPNVSVILSISSATKANAALYFCKTEPPETISQTISIQITDNETTSALTTPGTPRCDSTQQRSIAAGLRGQIWYWTLLGKTAILLLFSVASLAVKYKRG